MRTYAHPRVEDVELADVLKALGDPIRLRIFAHLLRYREATCAPLAAKLNIADSTLSHHLRLMREAGITRTIPDGVQRRVSLRVDEFEERFPGLIPVLARLVPQAVGPE